ncbi:MAG: hypothetical protein K5868_09490 [Lachnospiraceae bacterium]|nr:hypothetical protein [Lachnospiraceae bacterium]
MMEKFDVYYKYYSELSNLLYETEPYIALDDINFRAFSIKYNWLLQSVCSEVDVLMKEISLLIDPISKRAGINDCKQVILQKYRGIESLKVTFSGKDFDIVPWKNWTSETPFWWSRYNNIKHHRVDYDTEQDIPYYKLANQKSVLYALSGLYILEWCLLSAYIISDEEIEEVKKMYACDADKAIETFKGRMGIRLDSARIRIEQFAKLRTFFAGYEHFDFKKAEDLLINP